MDRQTREQIENWRRWALGAQKDWPACERDRLNAEACINEIFDMALRSLPTEGVARDAERYLDAIFAMADDGWLMHGPEGMSEAQEKVYAVAQEHPEYKRRVDEQQAHYAALQSCEEGK